MKNNEDNIVAVKSKEFAVRCVKLYKYLCSRDGNYIIGR